MGSIGINLTHRVVKSGDEKTLRSISFACSRVKLSAACSGQRPWWRLLLLLLLLLRIIGLWVLPPLRSCSVQRACCATEVLQRLAAGAGSLLGHQLTKSELEKGTESMFLDALASLGSMLESHSVSQSVMFLKFCQILGILQTFFRHSSTVAPFMFWSISTTFLTNI